MKKYNTIKNLSAYAEGKDSTASYLIAMGFRTVHIVGLEIDGRGQMSVVLAGMGIEPVPFYMSIQGVPKVYKYSARHEALNIRSLPDGVVEIRINGKELLVLKCKTVHEGKPSAEVKRKKWVSEYKLDQSTIAIFNGIADHVCRCLELDVERLKSSDRARGGERKAAYVRAREYTVALMMKESSITLKGMGALLGGRDHSTIINLRGNFMNHCQFNAGYLAIYKEIELSYYIAKEEKRLNHEPVTAF